MLVRRLSTALLLAGTALLAVTTPALAHTELKSSDPAKGASLPVAPQRITLTFSEPVRVEPGAISVTGPDGTQWTTAQPVLQGPTVAVPVTPAGPAGPYTIAYRVTSDDGHAITGKVPFTLSAPVPAAAPATQVTSGVMTSGGSPVPTPGETTGASIIAVPTTDSPQTVAAAQETDDGGVPVWIWVLAAVVLAGVGVAVGQRRRKA
jgi:copper resistance protein C